MGDEKFTDSTGAERGYPVEGLTDEQKAGYEAWWESVVEANAHNHDKPIELASEVDYDALARDAGIELDADG